MVEKKPSSFRGRFRSSLHVDYSAFIISQPCHYPTVKIHSYPPEILSLASNAQLPRLPCTLQKQKISKSSASLTNTRYSIVKMNLHTDPYKFAFSMLTQSTILDGIQYNDGRYDVLHSESSTTMTYMRHQLNRNEEKTSFSSTCFILGNHPCILPSQNPT